MRAGNRSKARLKKNEAGAGNPYWDYFDRAFDNRHFLSHLVLPDVASRRGCMSASMGYGPVSESQNACHRTYPEKTAKVLSLLKPRDTTNRIEMLSLLNSNPWTINMGLFFGIRDEP